ncbi:hypothetical protein G6F60_015165 [Rhizopus arrhizus]|nr:hypothetical protein G6F24_018906 [Rhizopus arrhizus]KAG0976943.1 hypothetical protein G6F27_014369 [Rhizopus arrhizus]KAG1381316.1 hypothetical protein G6F60_015165 [Rhizopus arrhizus]
MRRERRVDSSDDGSEEESSDRRQSSGKDWTRRQNFNTKVSARKRIDGRLQMCRSTTVDEVLWPPTIRRRHRL